MSSFSHAPSITHEHFHGVKETLEARLAQVESKTDALETKVSDKIKADLCALETSMREHVRLNTIPIEELRIRIEAQERKLNEVSFRHVAKLFLLWLRSLLSLLLIAYCLSPIAHSQSSISSPPVSSILIFNGAPTGSCSSAHPAALDITTGNWYSCNNGVWLLVGPGAAGSASWNSITSPTGNESLSMASWTSLWTWGAATGAGINLFDITDTTNNTGTGFLLEVNTASGSSAKPVEFCVGGTSNCVTMNSSGVMAPAGTAHLNADEINGVPIPSANSGTAGKIPIAQGDGTAAWSDPLIQGTQAAGSTTLPNPVGIGGSDYGGTPALRAAKVDSSGQLYFGNFPASFTANIGTTNGLALDATVSTLDTDVKSNITLHAGSAIVGKVGIDQTTPGTTNGVSVQDGAGNKITTNSSTYTAKFAFDTNLLGTLGTAFSTAGKVDVKGADGDVFVRQATAANLNATVVGTLSNNNAVPSTTNVGALTGIARTDYAGGTAATAGRLVAPDVGTDGLLHVAQLPAIRPCSYSASADFALSSTTDIAVLPGNASNTVLVTEIRLSGVQTTAGQVRVEVIKRSAADTAGTSAAMTVVPEDSNCGAAISAPLTYTGTGPSVGAAVGDVDNARVGLMATGTATPNDVYVLNLKQKPIVLRGTAQQVAVNLGGAVTGGTGDITFKFMEVTTITP